MLTEYFMKWYLLFTLSGFKLQFLLIHVNEM